MMIGAVPTSVPQLVLCGNWLAEGNFKWKWQQLRSNKLFWILSSVLFIHVVGLMYSQDLQAAYNDGRTKMPLLVLPLIFFTSRPLSRKEFYGVLYCFIAGCVANTLWCIVYSFVLHPGNEMRDASRFMSHIRLGLYLNVAIAACIYFVVKSKNNLKRVLLVLLVLYFIFVLFILGLASGLANFVILFFLALCVMIYRQKALIKIAGITVLTGFLLLSVNYIHTIKEKQLTIRKGANNQQQRTSPSGRPYMHFFAEAGQKENGNYIHINIQPVELQQQWKKQFPADSFNFDARHNLGRYEILIRYMASKGLNKDSAALAQLTTGDKENVRKGITNYEYPSWSHLHKRIYELVNEYDEFVNNRYINGHSLTMRLYFWKAAVHLVKQNPLFGVGSGDVQAELNKTYIATGSPLEVEWYKRPHNQFLTITVALGCVGLLIFLISLCYPALTLRKHLPKLYWPFFIVAVISFLLEDTLETQAGCTFYGFFTALFVSVGWYRKVIV